MTRKIVKERIFSLLESNISSICISGSWEAGKTHLCMNDLLPHFKSNNPNAKYAYSSLFGLKDLPSIKDSLAEYIDTEFDDVKNFAEKTTKSTVSFFRKPVVKDIAKIVSPKSEIINGMIAWRSEAKIRGSLVILDDIERKHESLSLTEVLGFIDSLINKYDCRVIILMNPEFSDKDLNVWKSFKEKVVEAEVVLDTSPEEALSIAWPSARGQLCVYQDSFELAVKALAMKNIRLIKKLISFVDDFVPAEAKKSKNFMNRFISECALLVSATNLQSKQVPTIDFIKIYEYDSYKLHENLKSEIVEEKVEEQFNLDFSKVWSTTLNEIDYDRWDPLQEEALKFLTSGHGNKDNINRLCTDRINNLDGINARQIERKISRHLSWSPFISDKAALGTLRPLEGMGRHLSPISLSNLAKSLKSLDESSIFVEDLIKDWVSMFDKKSLWYKEAICKEFPLDNIHQEIKMSIISKRSVKNWDLGIFEAALTVNNSPDENDVKSAKSYLSKVTISEFKNAIISIDGEDMRDFFFHMIEMHESHEREVSLSAKRFLGACLQLSMDSKNERFIRMMNLLNEQHDFFKKFA